MDSVKFQAMLEEDHDSAKAKMAPAPGAARQPTLSEATGKALAAGFSLKDVIAAALVGYATGGLSGAITAVLQLLAQPKQPAA